MLFDLEVAMFLYPLHLIANALLNIHARHSIAFRAYQMVVVTALRHDLKAPQPIPYRDLSHITASLEEFNLPVHCGLVYTNTIVSKPLADLGSAKRQIRIYEKAYKGAPRTGDPVSIYP
jgi:hypothetical protein